MKRILFILSFFCFFAQNFKAQIYETNLKATVVKDFTVKTPTGEDDDKDEIKFAKGDAFLIKSVEHRINENIKDEYIITTDKKAFVVNDKITKALDIEYSTVQDFWNGYIISDVLGLLSKKGAQSDLRREYEEDVLEYISKCQQNGLIFNDPYLETYIYSLIAKIAPSYMLDGKPGNINLVIVRNPDLNASMFTNGTLVINTGLLAVLHNEDELAAVLCHEIAHYVLDHSMQNINRAADREKRAKFWASIATAAVAVFEGVMGTTNTNYTPGGATIATAAIATAIAQSVCERLGMKYKREQEDQADALAIKMIKFLGYKPTALADALTRMSNTMKEERSNAMYFSGDHSSLINRIKNAGNANPSNNSDFEKINSFAVSDAASRKYSERRYKQSLELFNQNINNGVATANDYILAANCLLYLGNTPISNNQALDYVKTAKAISPNNIENYKAEILTHLRLNDKVKAQGLLAEYLTKLNEMIQQSGNSDYKTSRIYDFVSEESSWAQNMLIKLKGM